MISVGLSMQRCFCQSAWCPLLISLSVPAESQGAADASMLFKFLLDVIGLYQVYYILVNPTFCLSQTAWLRDGTARKLLLVMWQARCLCCKCIRPDTICSLSEYAHVRGDKVET